VIWVLLGSKGGDNAQGLRLARALNLSFETKNLAVSAAFETAKPKVEASLHHLDLEKSDALIPPWPQLVIAIGRRLSMTALWIKEQSQGLTKIVLIGCPKSRFSDFDLVVAPVHYRVPSSPNVCRIGLPPLAVEPEKLAAAAEIWGPRLAHLRRPLTVLLVGGTTGRRPFDAATTRAILDQAVAATAKTGGTLYVVTSRRTPADAVAIIEANLPADALLHRWQPSDAENPYLGLLAVGDQFIVTGDSISMLVEVARLGKPLAIAPLPRPKLIEKLFPIKGMRDVGILHDYLYRGGFAVPLGEPFSIPKSPPPDDTAFAADRIHKLLQ